MRVLVADDDPVGRQMIATAIELLGHDVCQVEDGRQALENYLETKSEILVLDWMMPHLDGIAVARKIRTLERQVFATADLLGTTDVSLPQEPMILLATAFDDAHLVAAALEAGVDDYMIKPVSMAEIRARIAIAIERHHLRREAQTREITLRRERARAEAISQARAGFLANMSHELRTPLNGMVGMSDFLLSGALKEDQREAVEIVRASALSLDVIINDILDLTQVDEGRIPVDPQPFDLRVLMDQMVGLFAMRASKSGLELRVSVQSEIPEVLVGDQTRIRQILSNLINNAIKYVRDGWAEMRVETIDPEADPPRYRFSVRDNGPGIPKTQLARIFQRFERGPQTDAPGYGLGLAICQGLAELMGGAMTVQSEVGRGSTFSLELALATGELPNNDSPQPIPKPVKPLLALVVEDDRFNQTVARRLLQRAGCRVEVAEDGRAGLQRLAESNPDIVFMDVQMPVMNGLDAARAIRKSEPPGQRIPIVGLTASSVPGARARCIEAGMDGYLQKPVQLSAIVEALLTHLPDHF